MSPDALEPMWFNFGDLGYPGWTPVTKFEARLMLDGATKLIEDNCRQSCEDLIVKTRRQLLRQAVKGQVNEHWISQAVLVMAMTGLLGYEIPEIRTWDE